MNYFLIVLLGWLLLFGKAAEMNKRSEESAKREQKEKKKETDENKVQQREPSIRVLLTDSSWQSCYHQSVTIEQKGKEHTYTRIHRSSRMIVCFWTGELMALRFPLLKELRILLFIMELWKLKRQRRGC
ncbi:MAG: hypothetical protein ACLTZM_20970 [Ruminococcus sp.]